MRDISDAVSNERLGAFILGSQPWNEEIEQMAAELLALRKEREQAVATRWILCSERMPVEKDIVIVVDDGYFVCEAQYREGDFFSAARGNNEFFETICRDVEFWQPLPEPPC